MAKVQRICQQCGNEFWVRESWLAWKATRGKFCSAQCAKQNQREKSERVAICLECGKAFKTQQWFLNRGEAKFCSHSCAASCNNRKSSQSLSSSELEDLYYHQKLSMAEIADRLGCSQGKVQYWMDHYEMARRSWDEASYVKQNPSGDPFEIQEFETQEQRRLFHLAIGLYIGEGTKSDHTVSLANSNPDVIRTWLRFLREICQVEEKNFLLI